nr:16S rRNA (uracil(1498)-N(3))-methyltransferase [Armatimonadota bacterium]
MVTHRFFVSQPLAAGGEVSLPSAAARQCFRVLKLRPGECVGLFDGTGLEARVMLTTVSADQVSGIVERCDTPPVEPPEPLEFVVGIPRQEKWEWILQKGTELGVTCFQPLETARCVARVAAGDWPKKAERWQKIILEAVEQSGRTRLPEL